VWSHNISKRYIILVLLLSIDNLLL
jgi:hypothetical protein